MSKDIAGSEQLKEQLFAILDKYYTLEHPDKLGIEPEHKLLQLIAAHDAEKKQQLLKAIGEDEPVNWHYKPNATYSVVNEESEPAHFRNGLRAELRQAVEKVYEADND